MLPAFGLYDVPNVPSAKAEFSTQFDVANYPRDVCRPDLRHDIGVYFRLVITLSFLVEYPRLNCVFNVSGVSNRFQVVSMRIQLIAVLVVDFHSIWKRSMEGIENQLVDSERNLASINPEVHSRINTSTLSSPGGL